MVLRYISDRSARRRFYMPRRVLCHFVLSSRHFVLLIDATKTLSKLWGSVWMNVLKNIDKEPNNLRCFYDVNIYFVFKWLILLYIIFILAASNSSSLCISFLWIVFDFGQLSSLLFLRLSIIHELQRIPISYGTMCLRDNSIIGTSKKIFQCLLALHVT